MSKPYVQLQIPYFSQWESPELVDEIVSKRLSASQDPAWAASGAQSLEEYELWSSNICGLACFKMILKTITGTTYRTMDLVTIALAYKCLDTDKGLYYKEFCEMVRNEFKLQAHFTERLDLERIRRELRKGNFVIASVHGSIRSQNIQSDPPRKGGHLVLLTGFDQRRKSLTYHDPSGLFGLTQINREISEVDFLRFTPQRGIIIVPNHDTNKKN